MKRTDLLTGAAVAAMLLATPLAFTTSADAQARRQSMPSDTMSSGRSGSSTTTITSTTRERVSVDVLRERLQPQGEFVRVARYGEVFRPRDVDRDWRPYTNGRWIFNQQVGWYFESDEPWAEITYHYGRWYDDPDQGWIWVAGTQWAPAWVEWRRAKGHVGWRPLPPDNAPRRVASRRGSRGSDYDVSEIQEEWVFVPTREILSERITTVIVQPSEVVEIYREARPLGRVEQRGGYAVNFALQPREIERETSIRIESRNLPRAEAAPVPQQVRAISTEERTTTSTTTRREGDANRPASATSPGGTDTQRTGDQTRPGAPRPSDNQANRPQDRRDTPTGSVKPGEDANKADANKSDPAKADADKSDASKRNTATDQNRRPPQGANARPGQEDTSKSSSSATDTNRRPPQGAASTTSGDKDPGQNRAEERRRPQGTANTNAGGRDRGQNRAEERRSPQGTANTNAGGQDRGQNRAEERRSPQGTANTNAGGQDRGPARAEQRRPEQASQPRPGAGETTGSTRPSPRPESPAVERGGGGRPAGAESAPRRGNEAPGAPKRKIPGQED